MVPLFSKLVFYYFSGTGNSANAACWTAQIAQDKGMKVELVNIAHCNRKLIPPPPEEALVVFCSPVHGFNYPPVMQSFIRRFPKGKNHVLLLNTRAGMLIGKWITPGLSGITFYLSAFILLLKGYRINAMFPVDLPSNWISIHPGLNDRTVKYLHERNKERVTAFANKTLNGEKDFRSLYEIIQDMVVSPVSLGYFFVGRFVFAKTFFASADCTNCNLCTKQCPVQAIKMVDNRPFWTLNCESCMHCMSICPHKAIETAHASITGFMILFSLVFWAVLEHYAGKLLPIENGIVNFALRTGLLLFLLIIWYRATHYLLRYKWFERIVTFTSLTHYKFWGQRYRALKDYKIFQKD